jgi:hypothetical protein
MKKKILVIACGAIARELVRVSRLNEWQHIEFQCLPPELHNRPEQIPAAVRAKIKSQAGDFEKTFAGAPQQAGANTCSGAGKNQITGR